MVNAAVTGARSDARAAERALALGYAPAVRRPGLDALFALDAALGAIVRTTREPLMGQMRLTWWHGALAALDTAAPPAEPVLRALAAHVLPTGVSGIALAGMVEGWEMLLDAPPDLSRFARDRGGRLFAAAATLLSPPGGEPAAERAGRGWALADLAVHATGEMAQAAADAARAELAGVADRRWPGRLRPLGALALLAAFDVAQPSPPIAGPRRVGRLAWHRLSGR